MQPFIEPTLAELEACRDNVIIKIVHAEEHSSGDSVELRTVKRGLRELEARIKAFQPNDRDKLQRSSVDIFEDDQVQEFLLGPDPIDPTKLRKN
jgi:hypothetical protein